MASSEAKAATRFHCNYIPGSENISFSVVNDIVSLTSVYFSGNGEEKTFTNIAPGETVNKGFNVPLGEFDPVECCVKSIDGRIYTFYIKATNSTGSSVSKMFKFQVKLGSLVQI